MTLSFFFQIVNVPRPFGPGAYGPGLHGSELLVEAKISKNRFVRGYWCRCTTNAKTESINIRCQ